MSPLCQLVHPGRGRGGQLFGWEFDTSGPVSPAVPEAGNYGFTENNATHDGVGIPGGVGGGTNYEGHAVFYVGVPAEHGARSPPVPPLAWATASALLARAVIYPPIDLSHGLASDYDRIDLVLYSPLCLLLGLGALAVARDLPRLRSVASVDGRSDRRTIRA